MEIFIKKSQIAIQNEDARSERFTVSDRVDAAIIELSLEKRKISLSIKRVEEINNEIAIKNYSDLSSGKSLPFANLSEKLGKKGKNNISINYLKKFSPKLLTINLNGDKLYKKEF